VTETVEKHNFEQVCAAEGIFVARIREDGAHAAVRSQELKGIVLIVGSGLSGAGAAQLGRRRVLLVHDSRWKDRTELGSLERWERSMDA